MTGCCWSCRQVFAILSAHCTISADLPPLAVPRFLALSSMYSIHVWHAADRYDSARPSVGSLVPPRDAGDMWVLIVPSLVLSFNRKEVPHWASHASTLLTISISSSSSSPVLHGRVSLAGSYTAFLSSVPCSLDSVMTGRMFSVSHCDPTWPSWRGLLWLLLVLVVHAESEVSTNCVP